HFGEDDIDEAERPGDDHADEQGLETVGEDGRRRGQDFPVRQAREQHQERATDQSADEGAAAAAHRTIVDEQAKRHEISTVPPRAPRALRRALAGRAAELPYTMRYSTRT